METDDTKVRLCEELVAKMFHLLEERPEFFIREFYPEPFPYRLFVLPEEFGDNPISLWCRSIHDSPPRRKKPVSLRHCARLRVFLRRLATKGVGVRRICEGVEYTFLLVNDVPAPRSSYRTDVMLDKSALQHWRQLRAKEGKSNAAEAESNAANGNSDEGKESVNSV